MQNPCIYCFHNLWVVSGPRNTVKLRDGPAAVIGNIYFFSWPLFTREGKKNKSNAESQKTNQVLVIW